MRQIVLDTETTGLAPEEGHRIIEVGCIEIVNRRVSSSNFHRYLNPEREIDPGASEVHGQTLEKLRDSPRFRDVVLEFLEFIRGAELIIHNAPFDVGFINHELARLGEAWGRLEDYCTVFDTLKLARERHPGQRNSLDALCRRYDVDNAHRELHGALLDAELLADVYLAMTGGQSALGLDGATPAGREQAPGGAALQPITGRTPRVLRATLEELAAHASRLAAIDRTSGGKLVWQGETDDPG
jgi:DNA polymerase III subunit epsilon